MTSLLRYVALPRTISAFEREYLARMNRIGLIFLVLHVPAFALLAALNDTRPLLAFVLTMAVAIGPLLAHRGLANPRHVSMVHGVAAMLMGGLLVHFGQGPLQIEMHFYFFALLAMLAVYGNPAVIIAATATVALHHLAVWLAAPRSVFNYEASIWVVGVHTAFVVLEASAACFIARSFFENVIGLERKVAKRTGQLARRNEDMRLVLDNVDQGLVGIDRHGIMSSERSALFDAWFPSAANEGDFFDALAAVHPDFAERSRLAFEQVIDGFMPLELTLAQMPAEMRFGERCWRFAYRPVGEGETPPRFLVVVSDVTSELARVRAELHQRETLHLFEHLLSDRAAVAGFFDEAGAIVGGIVEGAAHDRTEMKRGLHTLKGNAASFGLEGFASLCHELEAEIAERNDLPRRSHVEQLRQHWKRIEDDVTHLDGHRVATVDIDQGDFRALVGAIETGESGDALLSRVQAFQLEPARVRLEHFEVQARRIAARCDKPAPQVIVEDHGVRLDPRIWGPLWNALVHAVRNAIDHGIEAPHERVMAGKAEAGSIRLVTRAVGETFVIAIEDDGRGIDWEGVRALFTDGLSTAPEVTDISGRGVGMGAVLAAAARLGGTIAVRSQAGAGTCLELRFPRAAMTQRWAPVARRAA